MAIIVVIGRGLGKTNGSGCRRLPLDEVEAGGGTVDIVGKGCG